MSRTCCIVAERQPGAHPQNVVNQFMALGRDPRVAFLGNVGVGRDVQLQDLRAYYNAVTAHFAAAQDLPCASVYLC